MKHPSSWSKEEVHEHLQHALNLELWTIPLYLTSVYSIKGLDQLRPKEYPKQPTHTVSCYSGDAPSGTRLQYMQRCRACPRFDLPIYDTAKGIPFIHPEENHIPEELRNYSINPGPLNRESLKLFCAIELPHESADLSWENLHEFHSIAEFYEALRIALTNNWDELYVGDDINTKQKSSFHEYETEDTDHPGFSQKVFSAESASIAIDAIIEQGEGAHADHVPENFQPHIPKSEHDYHASWYKGEWSHFDKFFFLFKHPDIIPEIYSEVSSAESQQEALRSNFNLVLKQMESEFNSEQESMTDAFWNMMMELSKSITEVWKAGACPHF